MLKYSIVQAPQDVEMTDSEAEIPDSDDDNTEYEYEYENAEVVGNDLLTGSDDDDEDEAIDFEDESFTDNEAIDSQSEDETYKRPDDAEGKATSAEKQRKLDADFARIPAELQTIAQHHSAKLARMARSSKAWVHKHRSQIKSRDRLVG